MKTEWEQWGDAVAGYSEAYPDLLAMRSLQRRTDFKFMLTPQRVRTLLPSLEKDYVILLANGERLANYRTLYFDTPGHDLFHAHRRGRRVRQKVRIRHYPERQVSQLEVKSRRNELQTLKHTSPRRFGDDALSRQDEAFIRLHTGAEFACEPQVWTNFVRITLLGISTQERITVDLNLTFEDDHTRCDLGPVAIIEVKQWPTCRYTPALCLLRASGCRPTNMSKFITALCMTRPELCAEWVRRKQFQSQRSAA